MSNLYDYNIADLKKILGDIGEPAFRAGQIYRNFASGLTISEMTDLSTKLRAELIEKYCDAPVKIIKKIVSQKDGTIKYLFGLSDGNVVEGVVMSYINTAKRNAYRRRSVAEWVVNFAPRR